MSGTPTLVPAGRPTTTYAQLTGRAAQCIAHAQDRASAEVPGGRRPNEADVAAHRDLAAALVHLGTTLTRPGANSDDADPTSWWAGRPTAALT